MALYSFGRTTARHQREDRGQHRRQAVAEQDEIDEAPSHRLAGKERVLDHAEPDHDGCQRQRRDHQCGDVVDHAVGAQTQPLEPDGHGEPDADLQPDLGQARGVPVDVAAIDEVADFQEGQQHGQQDGAGIHHARGHVVAAAAQKIAAQPERRGGNAVAVEQPVEDRSRAHVVADDARLPADARQHQHADHGGKHAQRRQRPLVRNPGDPRHHQRERDREPAALQRQCQRERKRGNRAGCEYRARRGKSRPRRVLVQRLGRERIERAQQQRRRREWNRRLEPGDAVIERGENRDRREHRCRAPQDRHDRPLRTPLRQIAGAAEQQREGGSQHQMPPGIRLRRLGHRTGDRTGRHDQALDIEIGRPAHEHEHDEHRRHRHCRGRRFRAPGDRHRRRREHGEGYKRKRIVPAHQHQQGRGKQVGAERRR